MADTAQIGFWLFFALAGLLCGLLQRRGKDYFPANAFLGFAVGAQGVFYLAMLAVFGGNVAAMRDWAVATRAALWVYGAAALLVCWAIYLVIRANRAKPGSAMDSAGKAHPPTVDQVEEALATLERADHHNVANALQRSRARGWLALIREQRRPRGIPDFNDTRGLDD